MHRNLFIALAFAVGLGVLASSPHPFASSAPQKLKVLLVTGHDVMPAHDWRKTTEKIRAYLEEGDRFEVLVVEDSGIFESSTLGKYDVIVNNFGFWEAPELSPAARAGLLRFVAGGKGLVSMHFACSSYQDWPEYKDLIGRVWKKGVGGHGPRAKFTVKIAKPEHPIVAGLKDFEMDDELYAKLSGDAPIEVLATAYSADFSKQVEPMVFTLPYGKGRVVQDVLGHDVKALECENYKTLLRRSVEWAATGAVTVK
jgi:type 1 glutamine amidotransferase